MSRTQILAGIVVAASVISCADNPTESNASIYDDATVTLDVAASAGDAAAILVTTMAGNDSTAGTTGNGTENVGNVTIVRTRTCYDASNALVANCLPFSSVRMI